MKISFDLDDTLTGYGTLQETGQKGIFARFRYQEPIRKGTRELIQELTKLGHNSWIYTSSQRKENYILQWFASYKIPIVAAITGETNARRIKGLPLLKNPDAFAFDLHIDDEDIVLDASYSIKCKLLKIQRDDVYWTQKILNFIDTL
jgi:hypothetical protein